ncbi:seed linoleate 9S-lipoxygenase-3-like [Vigna radiata var. radiata]|uniref:Seed linoleate 9S-lipoxygenase-3-like n=1 Tax=Vigna radiata var. radiata TaxID=3916 RepID=A0A3Q0FIL2_VIGRR|nr:seed linoleate 9S-lipoxygenase-3-like [Vigna radiata var. radiata]
MVGKGFSKSGMIGEVTKVLRRVFESEREVGDVKVDVWVRARIEASVLNFLKILNASSPAISDLPLVSDDYDVYNDLGDPDKGENHARPILGGSNTLPYPRRGRTGRRPTRKDPKSESRSSGIYLPRDEAFGHLKSSDFLTYGLKFVSQNFLPALESAFDLNFTLNEFDSFDDVHKLHSGGIKLPTDVISKISPLPVLKEIFRTDGEQVLKFPPPKVIQVSRSAWMIDEEFAREMLAGVNPNMIRLLQDFPPRSKLDSQVYGDHTSKITKEHLEPNLEGPSVEGDGDVLSDIASGKAGHAEEALLQVAL